jgi:hypothetical protein
MFLMTKIPICKSCVFILTSAASLILTSILTNACSGVFHSHYGIHYVMGWQAIMNPTDTTMHNSFNFQEFH